MEQIELEQLRLLARKAQLLTELEAVDAGLQRIDAFAQGYRAAQPEPTIEE